MRMLQMASRGALEPPVVPLRSRRSRAQAVVAALKSGTPSQEARALAARFERFADRCLMHAYQYRDHRLLLDPVTGATFTINGPTLAVAEAVAVGIRGVDLARVIEQAGLDTARVLIVDLEHMEQGYKMFQRARLNSEDRVDGAVRALLANHPRKMMLCVSQTCNLRCVYCYAIEGNYHDEGRLMSLETAQQATRYLAKRSAKRRALTITLFGGEPLINFPMIKQFVPWATEWVQTIGKRVHFCITTNGTLLTDEVIDFLLDNTFSIMISLDGPKDVQDLTRPNSAGKGSFEMAAPRIRRLLERHPHPEIVKVRATMTHQSHDTEKLTRFFEEFGFHRIGLGANVGYSFYKGPFDLTEEDRQELFDSAERYVDTQLEGDLKGNRSQPHSPIIPSLGVLHQDQPLVGPKMKIPCGVGRNDQGIDVDGKVYPCHRYVGMKAYVIGNVWEGLDSQALREYYRNVLRAHKECDGCWATRWCSGHCSNYLSDPTGVVVGPDEPACDSIRTGLERNLALYGKYAQEGVDFSKVAIEV